MSTPDLTPKLALGQRVTFTWTLHRTYVPRGQDETGGGWFRKGWVTSSYPGQPTPQPREGILIGVRRLANGKCIAGDYETPTMFRAEEHFTAYLIAFDIRRNPVYCLPEHVEVAE